MIRTRKGGKTHQTQNSGTLCQPSIYYVLWLWQAHVNFGLNLKMEIESRKRHFNEDTSKKKYKRNLALRVDLGIPQTDTAGRRPSFSQKG